MDQMLWIQEYRYRAEGLMLVLVPLQEASAVTMEYKGQRTEALAVEHHRRWKLQTVTVQACGGGVLLYSSGCSSRCWIESAVAGKKGVDSSGNCDGQR